MIRVVRAARAVVADRAVIVGGLAIALGFAAAPTPRNVAGEIAADYGIGSDTAGYIGAVPFGTTALGLVAATVLGERLARRWVAIVLVAGVVGSYLVIATASELAVLVAAVAVAGLPTALGAVVRRLLPDKEPELHGRRVASLSVWFLVGLALFETGFLFVDDVLGGYRGASLAYAAAAAALVLPLFLVLPATEPHIRDVRHHGLAPWPAVASSGTSGLALGVLVACPPLITDDLDWSATALGALKLTILGAAVGTIAWAGRASRLDAYRLPVVGLGVVGLLLGAVAALQAHGARPLVIGAALLVMLALAEPAVAAHHQTSLTFAGAKYIAPAGLARAVLFFVGAAIGPWAHAAYDAKGPAVFYGGFVFLVAGAAIWAELQRRRRDATSEGPA